MSTIIRAATFNLKSPGIFPSENAWRKRRELLFDTLRSLDCDIIGVQELTKRVRSELQDELADYNPIGFERGGVLFNEHSDILVRHGLRVNFESTFRLAKNKSGRLYSITSPLAWVFPRICTIAEVTVNSHRLRVFNTHLDVSSEGARLVELGMICKRISELSQADPIPTLLMGDFNSLPGSRLIRRLGEGFGFENVKLKNVADELDGGTFHFFRGGKNGRVIDYIFASPEFTPLASRIVRDGQNGRYPSDHYPLVAELSLG